AKRMTWWDNMELVLNVVGPIFFLVRELDIFSMKHLCLQSYIGPILQKKSSCQLMFKLLFGDPQACIYVDLHKLVKAHLYGKKVKM
ncbi:hypothetical protein ACJX0J_031066, partial [Zea mays]